VKRSLNKQLYFWWWCKPIQFFPSDGDVKKIHGNSTVRPLQNVISTIPSSNSPKALVAMTTTALGGRGSTNPISEERRREETPRTVGHPLFVKSDPHGTTSGWGQPSCGPPNCFVFIPRQY